MGVGDQSCGPAALPREKRTDARFMGSLVGFRAALDGCGKTCRVIGNEVRNYRRQVSDSY